MLTPSALTNTISLCPESVLSRSCNFLAESGLSRQQMSIEGYGESKPRLPNVTDEGVDSPEGRSANRRAEILLDF